jgi:ligand-binding sensor domain-containing protein/DNA-binding CsgD family transcriptional regulator
LGQVPSQPFIIHYDNRDYQADFQNWSVSISADKNIYIGNNLGLLEFDGANWSLHQMPDNLIVRSVSASNDSVIYVGAYEEFGYWRKSEYGELSYVSLSDSLSKEKLHNDEIWRIIPHRKKIYFQSFSNIFVFDGANIKIIQPGFTIVLLQKVNDRLFIHGVHRGLYEIKENELELIPESTFLAEDEIKVVLPYEGGKMIIGAAQNGLYMMGKDSITPWSSRNQELIRNAGINNGIKLNDNYIFGTIANGILIFNEKGNLIYHLNTDNQLLNNTILSMASDEDDSFWAALYGGIEYIELGNDLSFYVDQKGELGSVFTSALYKNALWIGSNRGLYKYDMDPIIGLKSPKLIEGSQGPVWTLQIIDGELWCGHANGTYKIINNRMHELSDHNGGYTLRKITRGNHEYLIQSTYSPFVIYTHNNDSWRYSHTVQGFLEPINYFELDFQGNIWGNHPTKGIFKIKLDADLDSVRSYKYIGQKEGLPTERNLFVAKIENRIVFTTGELIYTYDDLADTIISYSQLNRQIGEYRRAKRILPIRDNHYWFILPDKIGWFTMEDQIATRQYEYNLNQQGAYLNSQFPKITILNDSTQLFCLDNGFAIFDERKIKKITSPPQVRLERISTMNKGNKVQLWSVKDLSHKIEIDYAFRNIEFIFSTDERIHLPQFSYQLEGLEENWSSWQENSRVLYTRLPHGNYTFKLRTRNERCIESKVLIYHFIITPPWYASKIAALSYILLVLVSGVLIRILFLKKLRKQAEKLSRNENEKRKQERLAAQQKYMKLKNEKLQSEIRHQNIQLANRAMAIIQKNDLMSKIKEEMQYLKDKGNEISDRHLYELFQQIDKHIKTEDNWKEFEIHFDQSNQHFFKRLKNAYPDLTSNDLRLCAYLRMNLSSKEIAPLLNISLRGVEIKRYRLRKRLNLDSEENLIDFLITF